MKEDTNFLVGGFLGLSAVLAIAVACYFGFEQSKVERAADIEKAKVIQEQKTIRTKERWDAVQRLPLLRKKEKVEE